MADNEDKPKGENIRIGIIDTDGNEVEYEVKKYIPIRKLFNKYCELKKKNPDGLILTYKDAQIDMHKSSEALMLEDGARLSVVGRQLGGGK